MLQNEANFSSISSHLKNARRTPVTTRLSRARLGRKGSDESAVPLYRIHHQLVHRVGRMVDRRQHRSCEGGPQTLGIARV
jgi:hypothetical protein